MKKKILKLLQSKSFKKVTIVIGLIFVVSTVFFSFDPEPFMKWGYFGVFIFNLFGTGLVLVPILASHMNIYLLSFFSALGMSVNDCVTWVVGRYGDVILPRSKKVIQLENSVNKYGVFAIFFWALIPFPFDMVGLIAGYLNMSFKKFVTAMFLGRFVRFVILGFGTITALGIISSR